MVVYFIHIYWWQNFTVNESRNNALNIVLTMTTTVHTCRCRWCYWWCCGCISCRSCCCNCNTNFSLEAGLSQYKHCIYGTYWLSWTFSPKKNNMLSYKGQIWCGRVDSVMHNCMIKPWHWQCINKYGSFTNTRSSAPLPTPSHCHRLVFNPCPGNGFCDVCQQVGVIWPPRHISSSGAHSNKISTAVPIFWGSSFSMVSLPLSRDVDIHQKSKMAS